MSAMRIKASGVSDIGLVRSTNEDAMALRSDEGFWAVADGMGGLQNGQWASHQVIAPLMGIALDGDCDADVQRIVGAILEANTRIFSAAQKAGSEMGTTVAALRIFDSRFVVVWAGDSRVYLYRGGQLVQLTRDHTLVQDLVEAGWLAREDAKHHPNAHIVSRAVGVEPELKLDVVTGKVEARDVFLLCSDGLTCVVADDEIGEGLNGFPPETAAKHLVELTRARGAPDNVTIIAVACEEITRVSLVPEAEMNG
jgi:serine/threonine protein phosphatase PrpC